jgi:hypothetical protein
MIDTDRLAEYVHDHLAGAEGATELLRHHLDRAAATDLRRDLERVLAELHEEREHLEALMADLDLSPGVLKQAVGWVAEKVSRLKREGERLRGSAIADLLELELLQIGIMGKRALWVLLRELADAEPRIAALPLDRLIAQAEAQHETVEAHRLRAGRDALTVG